LFDEEVMDAGLQGCWENAGPVNDAGADFGGILLEGGVGVSVGLDVLYVHQSKTVWVRLE
jgi:hypothetical protein